jgi:hypothetical protein
LRKRLLQEETPLALDTMDHIIWILSNTHQTCFHAEGLTEHALEQFFFGPENAQAWAKFRATLESTVVKAPIFAMTIVDSELSITQFLLANADDNVIKIGLALNSMWCWLLPIAWGWSQLGVLPDKSTMPERIKNFQVRDHNNSVISLADTFLGRHTRSGVPLKWQYPAAAFYSSPSHNFARAYHRLSIIEKILSIMERRLEQSLRTKSDSSTQLLFHISSTATERISAYFTNEAGPGDGLSSDTAELLNQPPAGARRLHWSSVGIGIFLLWGTAGSAIFFAYT